MDGKIPECSTGALRFLRARATTFAGPDIDIGAVPLVAMALGGCVLVAVAVWSNFNTFLVALSFFGVVVSPVRRLPTRKQWLIQWDNGMGWNAKIQSALPLSCPSAICTPRSMSPMPACPFSLPSNALLGVVRNQREEIMLE